MRSKICTRKRKISTEIEPSPPKYLQTFKKNSNIENLSQIYLNYSMSTHLFQEKQEKILNFKSTVVNNN